MSVITREIAVRKNVKLRVTRDDERQRLQLSITVARRTAYTVTLDAVAWNDLLQCIALPPALPLPSRGHIRDEGIESIQRQFGKVGMPEKPIVLNALADHLTAAKQILRKRSVKGDRK